MENKKLEGLGVTVFSAEDLAEYMNSRLVSLDVHVGGNSTEFSFPEKQLGMNTKKLSDKGKSAYAHNLSAGKMSVITKEQKNNFQKLEARARNLVKKYQIAPGIVLAADYDLIKDEFIQIRTEYLSAALDVAAGWEGLVEDFIANTAEMLKGVRMQERRRQQIMKEVAANIPTKEKFEKAFYMDLGVHAFNLNPNAKGLSGQAALDAVATFNDTVYDTAVAVIESGIKKVWEAVNGALATYYSKETISGKSLGALDRLSESLPKMNIFENECIKELANNLEMAKKCVSVDDKAWSYEEAMISAYNYAGEHGIELDMSLLKVSEVRLEDINILHGCQIKIA